MNRWLELTCDAVLPVTASEVALRRTEQRPVALQLERLMGYPMVAKRVEQDELFLHDWHYLIEEGQVNVLDIASGSFVEENAAKQSGPLDTLQ